MTEAVIGLAGVLVGIALTTLSDLVRAHSAFQRERLVASLQLLLLMPLLAIIALVIRMTSQGPVVVKDQWLSGSGRAGKNS
jgi:lipopolysaccharide/colanic/teichoic acid biosynthesis glycosyltransferase